jgi:hypothetical protein
MNQRDVNQDSSYKPHFFERRIPKIVLLWFILNCLWIGYLTEVLISNMWIRKTLNNLKIITPVYINREPMLQFVFFLGVEFPYEELNWAAHLRWSCFFSWLRGIP